MLGFQGAALRDTIIAHAGRLSGAINAWGGAPRQAIMLPIDNLEQPFTANDVAPAASLGACLPRAAAPASVPQQTHPRADPQRRGAYFDLAANAVGGALFGAAFGFVFAVATVVVDRLSSAPPAFAGKDLLALFCISTAAWGGMLALGTVVLACLVPRCDCCEAPLSEAGDDLPSREAFADSTAGEP